MTPTLNGYNLISVQLSDLAALIDERITGNDVLIRGLNLSNRELRGSDYLSYCTTAKYLRFALAQDAVTALVISPETYQLLSANERTQKSFIITENPEEKFYRIFKAIVYPIYNWATDPQNVIKFPGAIIEDGVIIGKNVTIGCNSVIKSGSIVGDNVTIGSCSVIGGEGFQMIKDSKGKIMDIPHVGRVQIGSNVFIGDNSTISKSLFDGFTLIGDNTKIDNHVHIAHNCIVGENCVLTAHVTLFGSCILEDNVWIAPNSSIMNRITVGEGAFVCAHSFASFNVKKGTKVFGLPAKKL